MKIRTYNLDGRYIGEQDVHPLTPHASRLTPSSRRDNLVRFYYEQRDDRSMLTSAPREGRGLISPSILRSIENNPRDAVSGSGIRMPHVIIIIVIGALLATIIHASFRPIAPSLLTFRPLAPSGGTK